MRAVPRGTSERYPQGVPAETVEIVLTDAEFAELRKRAQEIARMGPGEALSAALNEFQAELELRHLLDARPLTEAEEAALTPVEWKRPKGRYERYTRENDPLEGIQTSFLAPEGTAKFPIPEKARRRMGEIARDEAMNRVDEHADLDWRVHVDQKICEVARRLPEFSTDDVWASLDPGYATHEHRAMGPRMLAAVKNGYIAETGRTVKSLRPETHRNPKAIWRSLLYVERQADSG
jgi:hypothetical protein